MRSVTFAPVLMLCFNVLASTAHAAGQTAPRAVVPPEDNVVLVQSTTSGNVAKECEKKADKQKLKGLTREGYIENCVKTLSFTSDYGTR